MYFSDVYCDRRLPRNVRTHPVLLGECLGGALYTQDFLRLCREVGFPRALSSNAFEVRGEAGTPPLSLVARPAGALREGATAAVRRPPRQPCPALPC